MDGHPNLKKMTNQKPTMEIKTLIDQFEKVSIVIIYYLILDYLMSYGFEGNMINEVALSNEEVLMEMFSK